MTRVQRAVVAAIGVLAMTVGGWWLDSYRWAGGFRRVQAHFNGTCTPVVGIPSPEDLQIDHTTGVAYISSYDRAAVRRGENAPGAILAYDLGHPGSAPVNLTLDAPADFRPHGISLIAGRGTKRLLAINHAADGERVELFDLTSGRLVHAKTVRGAALTSLNDIAAVDADRFYVTNSRRYSAGALGWLESTFRLSWGNVVYYDGAGFREVLRGVAFPNGINRDRDAGRVFVVSSFDQAVHVYSRDRTTGALRRISTLHVGTRLDNVDVAEDGELWVAGRAQYLDSPQPSQVVRITRDGRVDEVYVSTGTQFGNASVAAVYGRHLLIGSSAGSRFMHCVMNEAR